MFNEQLEEIRKTKKTLLHHGKSLIHFVEDEAVDAHTLLQMITDKNTYINNKALLFERHRLSEKENVLFNTKFSVFLRGLIKIMNSSQADLVLEFLVRIYHVDTFNAYELLFLTLPFKRYEAQIGVLLRNLPYEQFTRMKDYSIRTIVKMCLEDSKLISFIPGYFDHYNALIGFLDPFLDEMVAIVKGSNYNCLNEFYSIFTSLINAGHHKKALEIYHRLQDYLDSDEFVALLLPYYSEDVLRQVPAPAVIEPIYKEALANNSGRKFLLNKQEISDYLQFCKESDVLPKEFNNDEYSLLSHVYLGTCLDISTIDLSNIITMYTAIPNSLELIKVLMSHPSVEMLLPVMNGEDAAFFASKCDAFHSCLLNDKNHELIIRNMKRSVFIANYDKILSICLEFVSFNPALFDRFVLIFPSSDVAKTNLIRLAAEHHHCLVDHLLPHSENAVYLSYLLNEKYKYTESMVDRLLDSVKRLRQAKLVAEACVLACNSGSSNQRKEFCEWAIAQDYSEAALSCIEHTVDIISLDHLIKAARKTLSSVVLKNLLDRQTNIVELAFEENRHDIIFQILKITPVNSLFISHPNVLGFLSDNFEILPSKDVIVRYCADNIASKDAFRCMMKGHNHLIRLRDHKAWNSVKIMLMDRDVDALLAEELLSYIVENLGLFSHDCDLFAWIFTSGINLDRGMIEKIASTGQVSAADLINEYVKVRPSEMLPVLPAIMPLLIKHRKESVRLMFEEFKDLLYPYATTLLAQYPRQVDLLTHLSPRHSLSVATHYFQSNFRVAPFDELTINLIGITKRTFVRDTCCSPSFFREFSQFLQSAPALTNIPEDLYGFFIRFYTKSYGPEDNSFVSELLEQLSTEKTPLFLEIAKELLQDNTSIFVGAYNMAVKSILAGDCQFIEFVAQFIYYNPSRLNNSGFLLCKKVYESKSKYSSEFISAACMAANSLVTEVKDLIMKNITGGWEVAYSLTILAFLFQHVPAFQAYRESVQPISALLCESNDELIALKARTLHQNLQFL